MKKIVIICISLVVLTTLGFIVWKLYPTKTTYKPDPIIASNTAKFSAVSYDMNGHKISDNALEPLAKMEVTQTNNDGELSLNVDDGWDLSLRGHDEYGNTKIDGSRVINKPFIDIVKFLINEESSDLHVVDANKELLVTAKQGDLFLFYVVQDPGTIKQNDYQYSVNTSNQYKFQVYKAVEPGFQTINFANPSDNPNSKQLCVVVSVDK